MAASIREKVVLIPKTIESLVILRGFQCCLPMGVHNLIIESDCQTVVNVFLYPDASSSFLGNFSMTLSLSWHASITVEFGLIIGRLTRHPIVLQNLLGMLLMMLLYDIKCP